MLKFVDSRLPLAARGRARWESYMSDRYQSARIASNSSISHLLEVRHISRIFVLLVVIEVLAHLFKRDATVI